MVQHTLFTKYDYIKALLVTVLVTLSAGTDFAKAQNVLGARSIGMGQAVTALANSGWGLFSNPAVLSARQSTVSFFGIRYYGLSEITDMAAVGTFPAKWGVIGVGAHRYGFELFSESRIRIAYKHSFQGFHYGAVLNYNHIAQGGGYGSAGAVGLDLGIAAPLFDGAWIGARATNINHPRYGNTEEPLPRELAIGLSYRLSGIALFTSDVVKDVRFPLAYRGGVEVKIFERFAGRVGVTTLPATFAAGFGYSFGIWEINVVAQHHAELGISPGLDLSLNL
ncbi:hypothetical protein [Halalkalibaculum sp. DA384]|uniref:hypothetical protein n=1 Tax=Halalkalibaculum sp. DA384 TaxID=3373606 RepID=UPI003754BBA9